MRPTTLRRDTLDTFRIKFGRISVLRGPRWSCNSGAVSVHQHRQNFDHLPTYVPMILSSKVAKLLSSRRELEQRAVSRHDRLESLNRWLESCRQSKGMQALALSDDRGCLIAGAGASRICDELAALAPPTQVVVPAAAATDSLAVSRGQAYLCASAGVLDQKTLSRFADGCSRILDL
jgi:hypothetical protein